MSFFCEQCNMWHSSNSCYGHIGCNQRIATIQQELAAVQEENASLKRQVAGLSRVYEVQTAAIGEWDAENKRLREALVELLDRKRPPSVPIAVWGQAVAALETKEAGADE